MRRTARGNRAPLAPLHDNSLRGDSPRSSLTGAKADTKQGTAKSTKPASKPSTTTQAKLLDKAGADLAKLSHNGSKSARRSSPVKPRKNVQLVTTSAAPPRSETLARIKQAVRKPAEQRAIKPQPAVTGKPSTQQTVPAGAVLQANVVRMQGNKVVLAGASLSIPPADPPTTAAVSDAQTPADESSLLRHWQLPVTPLSIRALLGPLESPSAEASVSRDAQYLPTQRQATPASTVLGAGTPQDFSDVFDLNEVST